MAFSWLLETSSTLRLRFVSTRYMMHMKTMVDLASSRDHESTSYHSGLEVIRRIAFFWKEVKGCRVYSAKKKSIHETGSFSSFSSRLIRSTGESLSTALSRFRARWYSRHSFQARMSSTLPISAVPVCMNRNSPRASWPSPGQ